MEEIAIIDQLEMLRIRPEDTIASHEFLFRYSPFNRDRNDIVSPTTL